MTMSKELFLALLSMDAYNRGYAPGVGGLGGVGSRIGPATITKQSDTAVGSPGVNAGFYALAYTVPNGAADGITSDNPEGKTTIISYRGTDSPSSSPAAGGGDLVNGWITAAGLPSPQADLAIDFYQNVTGHQIADGAQSDVILTGHSLGGGLAGFVSALTGTQGVGYDHMPFGAGARRAE